MIDTDQIRGGLPVVCSDNRQLGTVDSVEGDYIKLAQNDQGEHHWIPVQWVAAVDEQVHLARPSRQVVEEWLSGPAPGALGADSAYGEPRAGGYS